MEENEQPIGLVDFGGGKGMCSTNDGSVSPTIMHHDQSAAHAVAFAQNTRDEVRLIGGNGDHVGTISAEAGMKQQNYVTQEQPTVYPIDMRNATRTTGISKMHREGVGIGTDNGPAPTLTRLFTPAVAQVGLDVYNMQETGNVPPTVTASSGSSPTSSGPSVMQAVDLYNGKVTGDVACTLTYRTGGGGSGPYAMQQEPIGFKYKTGANHLGIIGGDKAPSLQADQHDSAVAHDEPVSCLMDQGGSRIDAERGATAGTLRSETHCHPPTVALRSIVRRLTPLECERLMGLPDFYTLVPTKKWRRAYDGEKEYVVAHIPEYEQYFKQTTKVVKKIGQETGKVYHVAALEIRTCLSADGPRYKACGNGWAVNSARVVVKRIHDWELAKTTRDLV